VLRLTVLSENVVTSVAEEPISANTPESVFLSIL